MKTYSRKKTGSLEADSEEVIIDLNEICRLCMSKDDELTLIYDESDAVPLILKIIACLALEVFEGDGLPDKVCRSCKYTLEKSYNFRKKCENSDLKLRLHLRDLPEDEFDKSNEGNNMEIEEEIQVSEMQEIEDVKQNESNTEQDLVGVQVAYIQQEQDLEPDPENITLPRETDEIDKEACTLNSNSLIKGVAENEHEETDTIYQLDENESGVDDANIDAIADAVKATLATQTGLNLADGQVQMTVNQSEGKSTQVEVTTEDGSVIIMELMTEEDADTVRPKTEPEVTSDGEVPVFQCPNCPKSFSRRIHLQRHASVHMVQRGFSCGLCEKWFPTRSALVRHERIHTGERPFQCEVCQKSFAQKEILFRHLMTHTGQKPYSCPHCNKGFSQKEPLRVHVRTHTNSGPSDIQLHYCSLCPKVFCHASGLSRHLLTHTGKTYKCNVCDRQFTDKSSLRRHYLQTGHQE